jgi:hypothetical protein
MGEYLIVKKIVNKQSHVAKFNFLSLHLTGGTEESRDNGHITAVFGSRSVPCPPSMKLDATRWTAAFGICQAWSYASVIC